MAAHGEAIDKDALKLALAIHTRSTRYLNAVAQGMKRHDLQGQAVEDMAPEHVHHALLEVFRRRKPRDGEDLTATLRRRIAQAFEASGLTREAYDALVRGRDDKANALLDEAFAEVAERDAKAEALARAFEASGATPEQFADMYGMDRSPRRHPVPGAGTPPAGQGLRSGVMWLGVSLFYVGAVLCLNGLWMRGHIADREIWVINVFVGLVSLAIGLFSIFGPGADAHSIQGGALTLLFAFTYLWVAANRFSGADGRGLGWFSLFVAITAVPVALDTLAGARSLLDWWMGANWAAWALLWALFWLLLARGRDIGRFTGAMCIAQGVLTGWLPGYLLLSGRLY